MNKDDLTIMQQIELCFFGMEGARRGYMVYEVALKSAQKLGVDNLEDYDTLEMIIRKMEIFCEKNHIGRATEVMMKEAEQMLQP